MFLKIAILLFAGALFKDTESASCFAPRDPLVLVPPSGCCALCPSGGPAPSPCGAPAPACLCFTNAASPCSSCPSKPKPACACLEAAGSSCGCSEQTKAFLYFPEVTYPVTLLNGLEPFYYNTCFGY